MGKFNLDTVEARVRDKDTVVRRIDMLALIAHARELESQVHALTTALNQSTEVICKCDGALAGIQDSAARIARDAYSARKRQ